MFVTAGTGENTVVYTYGRYGELGKDKQSFRGSTPIGEGVLIKLTGEDAQSFIKNQLDDNNARVYEFTSGSDQKVMEYFDNLFNSSDKIPTEGSYKDNPNARVIDEYSLFSNNCVTKSIEGIRKGVDNEYRYDGIKTPQSISERLSRDSKNYDNAILDFFGITVGRDVRKVEKTEIKKELGLN